MSNEKTNYFLSVHIQLRIECQDISRPGFQGKTLPPSTPCSGNGETSGGFPTAENFLKLVAFNYLQTTDPSKLQDSTSGFAYYLEKVRKVVIVDITQHLEGLWVTVECSSLRILEEFWNDYCSEYLSGLAQNTLVSKDILEELGLTNVKLRTTISEKEYRDCRARFLCSLGEYNNLFHLYSWQITLLFQFTFLQKNIMSITDQCEQGNKHEMITFSVLEGLCCFICKENVKV